MRKGKLTCDLCNASGLDTGRYKIFRIEREYISSCERCGGSGEIWWIDKLQPYKRAVTPKTNTK